VGKRIRKETKKGGGREKRKEGEELEAQEPRGEDKRESQGGGHVRG